MATRTFGSLIVHHQSTRSPNAAPARPANAASAAGVPSQSQPPRAATQVGSVKWYSVTIGVIPAARSAANISR